MRSYTSPLTTDDILAVVHAHSTLRRVHYGTIPLDALEALSVPGRPRHVIYNQSPSWAGPGTHWVSVYLDTDLNGEVMSSLGDRPIQEEVIRFMARHCSKAVYNTEQLQDDDSNCCGIYALSHGMARAKGESLTVWLSRFSECRKQNDAFIQCEFMRNLAFPSLFTPRFNWKRTLAAACTQRVECEGGNGGERRPVV